MHYGQNTMDVRMDLCVSGKVDSKKSEFLQLLSGFAMSSYNCSDYDMREGHIDKHFSAALKLSGVRCEQDKFIQDLTTSTTLAIYDGPYLRFCHRSLQEYFSAVFLSQIDDKVISQLIEEISDRLETDNVLPLLLSINPEKIEKHWVHKKLQAIEKKLKSVGPHHYKFYVLSKDRKDEKMHKAMSQIRSLYRFSGGSEHVRAAIDASRHMRISSEELLDYEVQTLFKEDYSNFLQLSSYINEKYVNKSSALRKLIGERASI
jgi:hypothetical protein